MSVNLMNLNGMDTLAESVDKSLNTTLQELSTQSIFLICRTKITAVVWRGGYICSFKVGANRKPLHCYSWAQGPFSIYKDTFP